jgi:hypothetical protein
MARKPVRPNIMRAVWMNPHPPLGWPAKGSYSNLPRKIRNPRSAIPPPSTWGKLPFHVGRGTLWFGRGLGAAGSSVPVVGDAAVIAGIRKASPGLLRTGMRQGLKFVGGPIAVLAWGYTGYQVIQAARKK